MLRHPDAGAARSVESRNGVRDPSDGATTMKPNTPRSSPPKTTDIAEKIYSARESGLEITQIVELDLGKNRK